MNTDNEVISIQEKMEVLTRQYTIAAALHFDYLKVIRALNGLLEHMTEVSGDKAAVEEWVRSCVDFAELKRHDLGTYCEKKAARLNELNEAMQNMELK